MNTPRVERDADAEGIFWEVRVQNEEDGGSLTSTESHYIRIKIFTDRGRDEQSQVEIPYSGNTRIKDLAARTVKPDGSIVELKKDAIFDRTVLKASGLKVRVKSFAMPAVEPGAIIEYRWREVSDGIYIYTRLPFQRDIPMEEVKYYIKPVDPSSFIGTDLALGMRAQTFHGDSRGFTKEKNGFVSVTYTNLPAFKEEPRMPPEDQVRTWMLIYYAPDKVSDPKKFWPDIAKKTHEDFKSDFKPNDDVKKAAVSITGSASAPDEKLRLLHLYCRTQMKNISSDASGLTSDDRKKLKDNKSPADTLKRAMGTSRDIDMLFAALALASGFEARVLRVPDRSDIFFDPNFADTLFLDNFSIAVKVNETWRFFDPGSTYVPYGMLRWQEEGQPALVCDPKEASFINTPVSASDKSRESRTATLRLSDDGTLEGDVKIEYTGHLGVDKKNANDDDSPAQREDTLRQIIKARLSTAELTNIKIEGVTEPDSPFVYSFHIRVPGYAQRTGKRLFLQPGFFEHGLGALFPTSTRKYQIYFHYPWSEQDRVTIELPEGFTLENAESPSPLSAGPLSKYEVKMSATDGRKLTYQRDFYFGADQVLIFDPEVYPQLKKFFDAVHEADEHTLTLRQTAASSN